jgi:pimeloyl-ACP methyl ester carboxylesterase
MCRAFLLLLLALLSRTEAEAIDSKIVVILFHGCGEGDSSRDWKPLLDSLPPDFVAIVPELPRIEADGDNTVWMAAWRQHGTATVDEAFARAASEHPGAFVVAGGAGCGGFFALVGAERHPVDAVLTLSGLSDDAQRELLTSKRIPVLGMASKDDGSVPARVDAIVGAGGPGSEMRTFAGKAHGTRILRESPEAVSDAVAWVRARGWKKAASPR